MFNVDPTFLKKIDTFDSEYISKMTADGQPGTPTEVYRRRERELRVLCKESFERIQH